MEKWLDPALRSRIVESASSEGRALDEAPLACRSLVARDAVRILGVPAAIAVTREWVVDAAKALPGALYALTMNGTLALNTPGLGLIAALYTGDPSPLRIVAEGSRLDQIGWPGQNDAALALWAVSQAPGVPDRLRALIEPAARWVSGGDASSGELQARSREAQALWIGASSTDLTNARTVLSALNPSVDDTLMAALDEGLRQGPDFAGPAGLLAEATYAASAAFDGWLAYHAHRGLPSFAAESSARAASTVASNFGVALWPGFIERAAELAVRSLDTKR
jgi:hypothetical protein